MSATESAQELLTAVQQFSNLSEMSLSEMSREVRFALVMAALKQAQGNQCRAAKRLKIHRNTLSRILDEMLAAGRKIPKKKEFKA